MKDSLLKYYQEELAYLREQGQAFAKSYPKIGSRLRLGSGVTEDPFVGRLLESFAFLTARVQHKIDAQKSTITQSLLNVLYPNFLSPIPSLSTIQLTPDIKLDEVVSVDKNKTLVAQTVDGKECQFMTCYQVDVLPLTISQTKYRRNINNGMINSNAKSKSVLSFKLDVFDNVQDIKSLNLEALQIYLNLPKQNAFLLQGNIFSHVTEIQIQALDKPELSIDYPKNEISWVGFDEAESLLPSKSSCDNSFRLLTELFIYSKKFLYLNFNHLIDYIPAQSSKGINIKIFFDNYDDELETAINESSLLLGCTPIVNLFNAQSIPINLDHRNSDYHIVPDANYEVTEVEVYQVDKLNIVTDEANLVCRPFFGYKYFDDVEVNCLEWYHHRKTCEEVGVHYAPGTESFINVGGENYVSILTDKTTLTADLLCTNRDMATQLPFGGDNPKFILKDDNLNEMLAIKCLAEVTPPIYRSQKHIHDVDLIALVTLGQVILTDDKETKDHIKSILSLCFFDKDIESNTLDKGILDIQVKSLVRRHPTNLKIGFCHGVSVTLQIDQQYFPENNEMLFSKVLHQYLSRISSINSFVELVLKNKHKEEICKWSAMTGQNHSL